MSNSFRPFRSAAVLGAGTMGSQIAAHLANAGLHVHLLDIAPKDGGNKNAIVEKGLKAAMRLKPDPFFSKRIIDRITVGNFDEHFDRIADVDWVIEVVIERLDIKKSLLARVDATVGQGTVISSNTSGLPIALIAEDCSDSFKSRFLGTHFFNPPRYLKLFEVIPTEHTHPDVLSRVTDFARLHLGKGTVIAKDRPYFIGNRIGIYGILSAMRQFTDGTFSIEEIDTLTGPLTGRPKSATFRTADVVGLDVMHHVISNLHDAVPEDESVDKFAVPDVLNRLVSEGKLGAKTRAGFYRKEGKEILSVDPVSLEYTSAAPVNLPDLDDIRSAGDLDARLRALWANEGRAGQFFRETTLDLLAYSARRIPEITDRPSDIDKAIRWGFGWRKGPFELWDTIGFESVLSDMQKQSIELPDWILEMQSGDQSFYRDADGATLSFVPYLSDFEIDEQHADEIDLASILTNQKKELWSNGESALIDIDDDVVLFEFRSKANSLGQEVMAGINEAIDKIENDPDIRGMVIGNQGTNFSVGANLGEAAMAVAMGQLEMVEQYVGQFQATIQRIRYAEKPVVVCGHQRILGGGCEMVMACPNPVLAAESYIGLVELGVGLIPAGSGTMRLAARAAEQSPNRYDSEIQSFLMKYFEAVAMAKVATSATEAGEMGFIDDRTEVVMNEARRFHVAKQRVAYLSEKGYLPPPVKNSIRVLGKAAAAAMIAGATQFKWGNYISDYDLHLATKLAHVMSGGELTGPSDVHEDYLLELEREAFMSLLTEEKTMERIQHILTTNKPLRN
ncbi:MAG: 3-hydroxyacyl-CoA dehydrogenase/enoyl-CoA hydratase family protein [Rhodothermales bacterium]|nr:3-hydroxyacyl-CoA dehydrogenase/enoyl-CoA hydratase family protein [Rhodothermales bacterium]